MLFYICPNQKNLATRVSQPLIKLDPPRSFLRLGESTEVECISSIGPLSNVVWEPQQGGSLPYNFRVSFFLIINCSLVFIRYRNRQFSVLPKLDCI